MDTLIWFIVLVISIIKNEILKINKKYIIY